MDYDATHSLNGYFGHHDGIEDLFSAYMGLAEWLFVAILALLFFAVRGHRRPTARRGAVAAGVSAAAALVVAHVAGQLVHHTRPFVAHADIHAFVSHGADNSFPSDHATAAFAIAMAIWLRNRIWGAVVFVLALALALGRVAVGVHYPSDVIAGALIGCLVALALWWNPVRSRLHALADRCSAWSDAALRAAWPGRGA